jgi:hypothetical protein
MIFLLVSRFPSDVSFLVFFSSFGKEKRKESKRQKEISVRPQGESRTLGTS